MSEKNYFIPPDGTPLDKIYIRSDGKELELLDADDVAKWRKLASLVEEIENDGMRKGILIKALESCRDALNPNESWNTSLAYTGWQQAKEALDVARDAREEKL